MKVFATILVVLFIIAFIVLIAYQVVSMIKDVKRRKKEKDVIYSDEESEKGDK